MKLREINKKEFMDFCEETPVNNFWQTKEYAELSRKKGWHTYFIGIDQNGKIKAATILLSRELKFFKRKVFYAPRGYIINFKDLELLRFFTKEIRNFIQNRKGIFLRIDPYYPLKQLDNNGKYISGGFNNEKSIEILKELEYIDNNSIMTTPNFIYKLKLKGKNEEELLNNCSENHKNIILNNIKKGFITTDIEEDKIQTIIDIIKSSKLKINFIEDLSLIPDLYKIFNESKKITIKVIEMDIDLYYENLINEKSEENVIDDETYNEKKKEIEHVKELQYKYGHKVIMGCNISICHDQEVTTICTAINNNFIEYNPIYTLSWDTIKDSKKNGFEIYNFYGISNDFTEENNVYQYYKGFNGEVVQLIGEFDLVINNFFYKHYSKYCSKHKLKITDIKKKSSN